MRAGNFDVPPRICAACSKEFLPKRMGFNARYCRDACKRNSQRRRLKEQRPEQLVEVRKRSYAATKKHPDRLEKHRECARRHREGVREWLAQYKVSQGCIDCGYDAHAAALQLDHRGAKNIEIADARSSIARLKQEIESGECEVRCANCHSIRTWETKQVGRKSQPEIVGRGCGEI